MHAEKGTINFGSGDECELEDSLTLHAEEKLKAMLDDKEDAKWSFSAKASWDKVWDVLRMLRIDWKSDRYFIVLEYTVTNPETREAEIEAIRITRIEID